MAASGAGAALAAAAAGGGGGGDDENVRVAVRCRPFNSREKGLGAKCIVEVTDGKTITLTNADGDDKHAVPATFTFDHAYFWDSTQEQVYEDLGQPILDKAMSGFNGTIFAYGQTGSGKTFSMMGAPGIEGIIPRLNRALFEMVTKRQDAEGEAADATKFLVSVSFLEIYNEVIKDLLNPSDKQLNVREHPKLGIYVQDLATLVVEDAAAVENLIEQGNKVRKVAATNMNDRSSRSHSCFTIKIEQKRVEKLRASNGQETEKTTTLNAKINLVDLAGSERQSKTGAVGDRLKEGAAINKSLTVLGNVINALAEGKSKHVPYRDSKLTRLLQESLGGNSMTLMIAAVSPADDNYEESLSTLRYADRAKQIKNTAKRNEDVNQAVIRELRNEIEELRRQLLEQQAKAAAAAAGGTSQSPEDVARINNLEDTISALEHAKQQSWEKQQELSRLYEEERRRNLANENKIVSVMQTIKEDNLETLRRLKQLDDEHQKLHKEFRSLRERHKASRETLASRMQQWQELHDADGGKEDGPHAAEADAVLSDIEKLHDAVEAEQKELLRLKEAIKTNEQQQEEARAEAAAQRRLLEEDTELRKAIAEEERKRLEEENTRVLRDKLEEEKRRLNEAAEKERQELLARFHGGAGAAGSAEANEQLQELELKALSVRRERDILQLEVQRMKAEREAEVARLHAEHSAELHSAKREALRMMRTMVEGYEEEREHLRRQVRDLALLLKEAAGDVHFLRTRNEELSRQLREAVAWEPGLD